MTREQVIQQAIQSGLNSEQINDGLLGAGKPALSDYEVALINRGRYGQNIARRTGEDIKEFVQGISTLIGAGGLYLKDSSFRNKVNQEVGEYGKEVARGYANPLRDATNLMLSPYGTNLAELVTNPGKGIKNLAIGAAVSPGNAIADIAMIVPAGKGAELASKALDWNPVTRNFRTALMPTEHEKDINKILNLGNTKNATQRIKNEQAIQSIYTDKNRNDVIRNLTLGEEKAGTEASTKTAREAFTDINKQLEALGVDPSQGKRVAAAQYILEKVNPNRTNDIILTDVYKAIESPTMDNISFLGISSPEEFSRLANEASRLAEEGKIVPISQAGIEVRSGRSLSDIGEQLGNKSRQSGLATTEQVARSLQEGYSGILRDIEVANNANNSIDLIAQKFGRKIEVPKADPIEFRTDIINRIADKVGLSPSTVEKVLNTGELVGPYKSSAIKKVMNAYDKSADEVNKGFKARLNQLTSDEQAKIAKGDIIVSPTEFKEGLRTSFSLGKQREFLEDYSRRMEERMRKGRVPQKALNDYANDLYVLPKRDLEAFVHSTRTVDNKFISAIKTPQSLFKQTVLAKPAYVAGNRIGNISLSAVGGADYLKTFTPGWRDLIPDYLKQSTSLHGINPGFDTQGIGQTISKINRDISRDIANITDKELDAGSRAKSSLDLIRDTQEYITRPLFQGEASLELRDRAAVYFNQAKKYARETGQDMDTVLKEALTNQELQTELIDRTNKVLGDYLGRNYYINPTAYETGRVAFPFAKVLTTSKDVLFQQLRDNPLRMQLFMRNPARVGYDMMTQEATQGNQPLDNDPRGGLTSIPTYSSRFPAEKMFSDYNPIAAPGEIAMQVLGAGGRQGDQPGLSGLLETIGGNLSYISGSINALQGKDQYGNPVVGPNTYKGANGELITLDELGNKIEQPSVPRALAQYIGRNFLGGATSLNQAILPLIGAVRGEGKGYVQPTGSILGGFEDQTLQLPGVFETGKLKDRNITDNILDWALKQGGIKTRDVYFPRQEDVTGRNIRTINRRDARDMRLLQYRRMY